MKVHRLFSSCWLAKEDNFEFGENNAKFAYFCVLPVVIIVIFFFTILVSRVTHDFNQWILPRFPINMSQAGQHQKEDHDEVVAAIKAIPFHKCTAYRKLASAFAKIHSKLYRKRQLTWDIIWAHTNALRPKLTEECKNSLFLCCVNHLRLNHPDQLHRSPEVAFNPAKFGLCDGFYKQVHVDEKWF